MTKRRILVGAISGEGDMSARARALRDAGNEVVLVGSGQTAEQLLGAAVAEDADEVVVGASEVEMARLISVRAELGADHIQLTSASVD